jgi:septum formation protein
MQNIKQKAKIILASSSKVRKQIMEASGLEFEVMKPFYDEDTQKAFLPKMTCKKLALFLAKEKALSVSEKFKNAYVIGSDQVCEFENSDISKSENSTQAIAQLKKFNGKIHFQNNATVVAFNGKIIFENFSRVKLQMRKMSAKEIENYVAIEKPWGCAGSYKYESLGKHLFVEVSGDYFAILGLTIQPLISFFHAKKIISL